MPNKNNALYWWVAQKISKAVHDNYLRNLQPNIWMQKCIKFVSVFYGKKNETPCGKQW